MNRVLVTGGAGFIGSHVVDKLIDRGITPRIFDVVPSPHHAPGEVDTYLGDLTDTDALVAAANGCDAIIHLAAIADVNHVAAIPGKASLANSPAPFTALKPPRTPAANAAAYGPTTWASN